jgi:low affinity Fe/Cu permease
VVNTVTETTRSAHMPSDVSPKIGWFDRFAGAASNFASRAWFFAFCVLLVLLWAPSYFVIGTVDTWQLIINTITTIVTFLLVALLQNSQTRADAAVQDKLNAVAAALSGLMEAQPDQSPELREATRELRRAVGLEDRESS